MEKEYYVFFTGGMTVGTEEWYNDILPENFATSYEEIANEGKMMPASDAQIEFYRKHQDYDLYHLFYMLTLTEEERIARGLSGDYLNNLEDRGNVFENARVQSETIKRKRIENKEDMR